MVIEQIAQMKRQGIPTNQIIQNLRQQGISPKEINEALSQSEIKSEITNNQGVFPDIPEAGMQQSNQMSQFENQNMQPQNQQMQNPYGNNMDSQMQPSISQQPMQNDTMSQGYPSEMNSMQQGMSQGLLAPSTQDYSQYQEYDQGSYYPEYSSSGGGADIETINDISSQIIEEKTKHIKKEFSQFTTFKKESKNKLEELDKRLTKLEDTIEDLKLAIIKRVGEYGEDLKDIANEMRATQDSFRKVINPLTEKAKSEHESRPEKKHTKSKSKKSDSFEDYLR